MLNFELFSNFLFNISVKMTLLFWKLYSFNFIYLNS